MIVVKCKQLVEKRSTDMMHPSASSYFPQLKDVEGHLFTPDFVEGYSTDAESAS